MAQCHSLGHSGDGVIEHGAEGRQGRLLVDAAQREIMLHRPFSRSIVVHQSERGVTFGARFAAKSARRAAASEPVIESAAIRLSTKSPSASLMSWMRGSACSTPRMVSGAIAATFAANSPAFDFASPFGTRYCTSPARSA